MTVRVTCSTCATHALPIGWKYARNPLTGAITWRCTACNFARSTNLSTAKAIDAAVKRGDL